MKVRSIGFFNKEHKKYSCRYGLLTVLLMVSITPALIGQGIRGIVLDSITGKPVQDVAIYIPSK